MLFVILVLRVLFATTAGYAIPFFIFLSLIISYVHSHEILPQVLPFYAACIKKIYTAHSFYESLDRNGACYLPRKSKSCGTIFCSKCEPESMLKLSSNSKTLSIKLAVLDNLRATEK